MSRERKITMRKLGAMGRAGNQFFQYAFLTGYAFRHDLRLEIPPWVGNELFGTDDPAPSGRDLPTYREVILRNRQPTPPKDGELIGMDFVGYAQYHTSYYSDDRIRIRKVFQPTARVRDRLEHAEDMLLGDGATVIGIHLRRGDYGRSYFPIIPTSWYLRWLENHYAHRFHNARVFIATEDLSLVDDFNTYLPFTTQDLGVGLMSEPMDNYNYLEYDLEQREPHQLDWYPDFYLLSKCHVILAPNSTFSFFAAMLDTNLQEFWRARLSLGELEQIDVWNSYPLLREFVNHYPHLEGISVKSNPYW